MQHVWTWLAALASFGLISPLASHVFFGPQAECLELAEVVQTLEEERLVLQEQLERYEPQSFESAQGGSGPVRCGRWALRMGCLCSALLGSCTPPCMAQQHCQDQACSALV